MTICANEHLVLSQHHNIMYHAAHMMLVVFMAILLVTEALPTPQFNLGRSVSQKVGQQASAMGITMTEDGAIFVPKSTSTQKQQEKLTKALNGTISALSSKTSDQTRQLELKLTNVTQNIDEMKSFFNASISEWKTFITKQLDEFNNKVDSLDTASERRFTLLASKLEAHHNASVNGNNNGLKSVGGYQGARLVIF